MILLLGVKSCPGFIDRLVELYNMFCLLESHLFFSSGQTGAEANHLSSSKSSQVFTLQTLEPCRTGPVTEVSALGQELRPPGGAEIRVGNTRLNGGSAPEEVEFVLFLKLFQQYVHVLWE